MEYLVIIEFSFLNTEDDFTGADANEIVRQHWGDKWRLIWEGDEHSYEVGGYLSADDEDELDDVIRAFDFANTQNHVRRVERFTIYHEVATYTSSLTREPEYTRKWELEEVLLEEVLDGIPKRIPVEHNSEE